MPTTQHELDRRVPPRALGVSLFALAVPVVGSLRAPGAYEDHAALLWLLALVPAFLLAYHRGWKGVATALAAGMAALSLTQAVALGLGREMPDLLAAVVVAYLGIALAVGWLAESFRGDVRQVGELALTDSLTLLPNRRHAHIVLENEFAAAVRGRPLAVVLFDLDDFKAYNDEHGHQAGDAALCLFAEVLAESTRKMDLSARFGGEEFLSVLADSDGEGAAAFAERVRMRMRQDPPPGNSLTVSAGVACYLPDMDSFEELLAAADLALYRAKDEGRDCVRLAE